MTDDELDRLAEIIARTLLERARAEPARSTWLPSPVRPQPPERGGDPPSWSGAAQDLGDIAPTRDTGQPPRYRASTAELARVTRAAAAGQIPPPDRGRRETEPRLTRRRAASASAIDVRIGVSNRHVHLSAVDAQALFGSATLTVARALTQPGQFAAQQTVTARGPSGSIDGIRIVGPARGETQLEIAASDARVLGVDPPVAASGSLASSAGNVTLVGPAGRVELSRGVIVAARHLHLAPADARRWGLRNGDLLDVRCGIGARAATLHDVLVRSGEGHATELHLDVDEARAAGVKTGDSATVMRWRAPISAKRPLVTEHDVMRMARDGTPLPSNALLTPSARDRARALGMLLR